MHNEKMKVGIMDINEQIYLLKKKKKYFEKKLRASCDHKHVIETGPESEEDEVFPLPAARKCIICQLEEDSPYTLLAAIPIKKVSRLEFDR